MIDTPGLFVTEDVAKFFLRGATRQTADALWITATDEQRKVAREKARVRLNQLVRVERLRRYDSVQFGVGTKSAVVFGSPQYLVKRNWLKHDAYLWRFLRKLRNARHMLVGFDCDRETREDALVTFSNGLTVRVEMNMETESLAALMNRFDILKAKPEPLLFVTLSRACIERVKARAAQHSIADRIAFGIWRELTTTDVHAWEDGKGIKRRLYPVGG